MSEGHILSALGEAIKAACKKQRWSLRTLAEELGISDETLARWRDGKVASINLPALVRIFNLAGMSIDASMGVTAGQHKRETPGGDWMGRALFAEQELERYRRIVDHLTSAPAARAEAPLRMRDLTQAELSRGPGVHTAREYLHESSRQALDKLFETPKPKVDEIFRDFKDSSG